MKQIPAWALKKTNPYDLNDAIASRKRGTIQITWPDLKGLKMWAKKNGWPTPWFGFESAFVKKMLENESNFGFALNSSGIQILIPKSEHLITDKELDKFDKWYAARSTNGTPEDWGILVESLREIRRAVEAGVKVTIAGKVFNRYSDFYGWVHNRYHALEEGYDKWVGDDS